MSSSWNVEQSYYYQANISYTVNVVSQILEAPCISYWEAVACIIRYLKGALGLGILYKANGYLRVEGFLNRDWAGSPLDRPSTTIYCTFLGGNLVTCVKICRKGKEIEVAAF